MTVFIFVKIVPSLINLVGLHGLFFTHGSVLAFATIYALALLPETRGKTLTQLCALYQE